MNQPALTPTPRTDAGWAKTFLDDDDQCRAGNAASDMRDECAQIETELIALRAELTVAIAHWNGALERAMKVEADLVALAQCHDDNCRAVVQLAEELAKERARLDAGTILLTVAGERVWHCGVDLRAAIDAAMKEDAK